MVAAAKDNVVLRIVLRIEDLRLGGMPFVVIGGCVQDRLKRRSMTAWEENRARERTDWVATQLGIDRHFPDDRCLRAWRRLGRPVR